jgi:cytochrome c-type biogenesis protein
LSVYLGRAAFGVTRREFHDDSFGRGTLDLGSLTGLLARRPIAALALVYGGGVLTSLTPCIYPMIPITAGVVGGQSSGRKAPFAHVLGLTLAYVLGLALVYASLGLIAGLSGTLFGAISTNPWLYLLQANALAVFALMMLDVIPVPVPQRLLARAASLDSKGRAAGAFAMGAASGLVAAPCGAPVMGALLTWVASTKSGTLGFVYLFTFSLGMCSLLVVVGLAAGGVVQLPRSGPWLAWVKRGFAILMLGSAEYYLVQMGTLLS